MENENYNHNVFAAVLGGATVSPVKAVDRPDTAPPAISKATVATPITKKEPIRKAALTKTPLAAAKTPVAVSKTPAAAKTSRPKTAGAPLSSTKNCSAAKQCLQRERTEKTAALKERWAQEREEHMADQQRKKEVQQKVTRDELQAIAEKRKLNREKERRMLAAEAARRNELLKHQNDDRAEQTKILREQEKKRRRESAELKQKIAREAQGHEREIEQRRKEEEQSLLESRRVAFLEARNAAKESEISRRQSMMNRGKAANIQREITKKMEKEKKEEEKGLLEFRREVFEKKREFEKDNEEDRRRSLAFRLDEWRATKHAEEEIEQGEKEAQKTEAEIRTQDWMDLQEYKRGLEQKERESLERRLEKWREEKTIEAEAQAKRAEEELVERELFAQECQDVMTYREQQEASRRQSLAYRLAVGRRDRDWEEGVEANRAVLAMQDRQLQMLEREDVDEFRKQLDTNRRASLSFRLQQSRKEAQFDMGKYANEVEVRHEEHQISIVDHAAMREYQQGERDKERMELATKLVEAKRAHEIDLTEHRRQLNIVHDILATRRQDWIDTQAYRKAEKESRRKSVCLRLDSWRQEKMAGEAEKNRRRMEEEEDAFFKQMDHVDNQAAKQLAKEEEIVSLQLGSFKF